MSWRRSTASAKGPCVVEAPDEALETSLMENTIRAAMPMQRALSAQGQERSPSDFTIFDATIASEQTIIGRVIEKGLHDELKGSAYLVLDGIHVLAHYLPFCHIDAL